jgi:hypothetical protein
MQAQMAQRTPDKREVWCLYVCIIPGRVAEWPEHFWPASHRGIPTIGQRDRALKKLGYRRASDTAPWDWQETEGKGGSVKLFASIEVLPE